MNRSPTRKLVHWTVWGVLSIALGVAGAGKALAASDFGRRATWDVVTSEQIRMRVRTWLDSIAAPPLRRREVLAIWERAHWLEMGGDATSLAVLSAAEIDERAARLRDAIEGAYAPGLEMDVTWLDSADTPAFVRGNLKLAAARYHVYCRLFEQADALLRQIELEDVLDPAALLFYRGLVSHELLQREEGIAVLARLLERESEIPRRFAAVSKSMVAELRGLEEGSLDHISRQMGDVERRLSLGHGGKQVRKVEDDVVAALDKLIKDLEDQQSRQSPSASSSSSGGKQSGQPADQSLPLGGKGEGRVAKKDIGDGDGWGALDPRQREEILQNIGRDFPAHLRDVIQQYFRDLAETEQQP